MAGRELTAREAAEVLGVKPSTLYAYVSRGRLTRLRTPEGSRFDAADVERLARSARRAQVTTAAPLGFASELTLIENGRLYYRGVDAVELSRSHRFEHVAAWLWEAVWAEDQDPWTPPPAVLEAASGACHGLDPRCSPTDRWRVAVAAAASADPLRHDRARGTVVSATRGLLATLVEVLPVLAPVPGRKATAATLAERLWPRLSPVPATSAQISVLNAALVLMADHEIAASTLAARTAAAVDADPYAVILTGMSAASGPLHAANSLQIRPLLADAQLHGPAAAVGEVLRRGGVLHGFGQPLYPGGDPRGAELLESLRRSGADLGTVDAVLALVAARGMAPPNCDFALAALAQTGLMVPGASEAIFVLARSAGWIAHALEEYAHRSRFRVRATYVGPRPGAARERAAGSPPAGDRPPATDSR
ncbi:MAG TPA: citrate synthase [Acidimicrobiales bacterium]|nr:citrate synthase [Acidimicrobiales bacterium]